MKRRTLLLGALTRPSQSAPDQVERIDLACWHVSAAPDVLGLVALASTTRS